MMKRKKCYKAPPVKPIKSMWVCINSLGDPIHDTITYYRKKSIEKLIDGTQNTWDYCKSEYGFKCVHVNINFTIFKTTKP